ncbi:MAG: YggT family protein [Bifidobacterium aquikefiri]|uniref:Hemolysin n=1 Tax=Bifidobacterium aquikefiri TaxID=1653207 RepID=A0A261G259_9BIFI|nr:YggT family protein [Bifidobacterium aquikefiri]OZG65500.1 hemolysin [Bifidobacterium aquikefiri]
MLFSLIHALLHWAISAYLLILFARMILDWSQILAPRWYPQGIVASLLRIVYRVTDPPLRWLRRFIPPLPLGAIQLDMSFMVLYFVLVVLQILI